MSDGHGWEDDVRSWVSSTLEGWAPASPVTSSWAGSFEDGAEAISAIRPGNDVAKPTMWAIYAHEITAVEAVYDSSVPPAFRGYIRYQLMYQTGARRGRASEALKQLRQHLATHAIDLVAAFPEDAFVQRMGKVGDWMGELLSVPFSGG